ncbi:MAG: heat-inducible transcription repressor HrcA [Firmicutes bacterium]|nr:heat-inducible transcription repressor HrcA [Bacillota bacterium]
MDERKKRVLSAIINDYIANAEPVGSRTITKRYDLGVSPATVRNEMSDLTDEGYIEQPHTSAGRIPSAKGYRFYVDNLMERQKLTPDQLRQIRDALAGELSEIDSYMRSCINMMSRLTNYPAFALVPARSRGRLENIQLVPLNDRQVLAVLQTSVGIVQHKVVDLTDPVDQGELMAIENGLRNALRGRELTEITEGELSRLMTELHLQQRLRAQTMSLLETALRLGSGNRVFTGGVMNMLSQPEFQDIDRLRGLANLLEEENQVSELLDKGAGSGPLTVTIGSEMPVESARDCSMVVANYFINGEKAGSIGVLGPTRMSYGRTVSLMEQIAGELSRALSDKEKK